MPVYRSLRRFGCPKPKYVFSDDEDDDDFPPPTKQRTAYVTPTPPPSTSPSETSSHSRKRPAGHIRRPRNAFIIFRSQFCANQKMKESGIESDHRHISRIAGYLWNSYSKDQKAPYEAQAALEKAAHRKAHPEYRYSPVSRPPTGSTKRKVKRNDKVNTDRPRQLAELIMDGVSGEALQEATKGIDQGSVRVELTKRTAKPAKRTKHTRKPSLSLTPSPPPPPPAPAVDSEREVSADIDIKLEPSPSPQIKPILLSPFSSSGSEASDDLPATESVSQDCLSTPALSCTSDDQDPELTEAFDSPWSPEPSLQSSPPSASMDCIPLSDNVWPKGVLHPHMRPVAPSKLTLAGFSTKLEASSPAALHTTRPLPLGMQVYSEHWDTSSLGTVLPQPPSGSDLPPVFADAELHYHMAEHSPSPADVAFLPGGMDADDISLARDAAELRLRYPDDPVDSDEDEMEIDKYFIL